MTFRWRERSPSPTFVKYVLAVGSRWSSYPITHKPRQGENEREDRQHRWVRPSVRQQDRMRTSRVRSGVQKEAEQFDRAPETKVVRRQRSWCASLSMCGPAGQGCRTKWKLWARRNALEARCGGPLDIAGQREVAGCMSCSRFAMLDAAEKLNLQRRGCVGGQGKRDCSGSSSSGMTRAPFRRRGHLELTRTPAYQLPFDVQQHVVVAPPRRRCQLQPVHGGS